MRRTVAAELDRTHLTAQVALPDGLDLHVAGKRCRPHEALRSTRARQRNTTRNFSAPRRRQYTATGGMSAEVTIISATCDGACDVPRSRCRQKRPVSTAQAPVAPSATGRRPASAPAAATASAPTLA